MTAMQTTITNDLIAAECDWSKPTFTWDNISYPCMPSPDTEILKLNRGYDVVRTLSLTVRLFNADGSFVFPSNQPPISQDDITYEGEGFTVEDAASNLSRAFIVLTCTSNTKDN